MTITDHILVVISFRQVFHYNKALWSKNFFHPDFQDLDSWQCYLSYGDRSAVIDKSSDTVCDCLWGWHFGGLLPLASMYTDWQTLFVNHEQKQRTTNVATSNMVLFSLCPLEGKLKWHATFCMCVVYPCVMYSMCGACVASRLRWMWQHGIFVLQWGMPLTLLSLIKTQMQQQSEHKHTPWSVVFMGIHAWGLNTTKQCWIASEPQNKQTCAKLAKHIATKFALVCSHTVWLWN